MKLTQSEFDALPYAHATTNGDGSKMVTWYTRGRWPKFQFEGVEIVDEKNLTKNTD